MWVSTFCVLTGHRELKRVIWVISRHLQVELPGLRGSSQRCGLFFSVFAAGDFTKLGFFFLDITDIRAVSDLTLELMARGWNCGPPHIGVMVG